MEVPDELDGLRALHQDLIALEEGQLRNIDKLCDELRSHVEAFRKLLDKPPKSDASRTKLNSGTLQTEEGEYAINEEFQESTIQLADAIDLDEIEAAKLILNVHDDAELLGRSPTLSAVIAFHEKRQFLLESLRMLMRNAEDPDCEGNLRREQLHLVSDILEVKDGPARNGSLYTRKCLNAMVDIEKWINALAERYQGALALGQPTSPEYEDVMRFQQSSLAQQHESLGAIMTSLVKGGYTAVDDFYKLLDHLSTTERWNNITAHLVPATLAFTSQYGSPDSGGDLQEARVLNKRIMDSKESSPWVLRNLQAAVTTWWLSEYSGWHAEQHSESSVRHVDLDVEARKRSDAFLQALQDGAFHCTLSLCSQAYPDDGCEPVRSGLTEFLLRDTLPLSAEAAGISSFLRDILMEQVESFVNAFITHMPDTLRQFQSDEDDQRKKILGGVQPTPRNTLYDQDLHLERFLVIIAYAFDKRIEAAESFWADPDSNLYGFLQWASRRQSTPRVGAFCEMLRAISRGEECATAAHQFLLDEGNVSSARIRRSTSLNWGQILSELTLYATKIRDNPTSTRPSVRYGGKSNPDDIDEPESALMLECYLRLMTHICGESSVARSWLWAHDAFQVMDVTFTLADLSVPSRLQACALAMVRAILTNKTTEASSMVWTTVDHWASNPSPSVLAALRPGKSITPMTCMEEITFDSVSKTFDQANEFTALLQALVAPCADEIGLYDALPFPEQLGAAYRMSGIEPYIDFVFGKVFASNTPLAEDPVQSRILSSNILNLATTCLGTFNENLVVLANRSTVAVDTAIETSSLAAYVRLHPFSRVMEWMFNDRVVAALFAAASQDIDELASAAPGSPIVVTVLRSIETMNHVMDLQSTYFEIVRPLIKLEATGHRQPVLNPTLASFEDSVAVHLDFVVNLGLYSGIGNQELTTTSLRLLEKFSSSKRLNISPIPSRQQLSGNRLVGVLEQHDDLERVRTSFILAMQYDERELELGPAAPGWKIKSVVLDFLGHSLSSLPDRPNLAHAILGFKCTGATLTVESDGPFAKRTSLFHSIVQLAAQYPDGLEGNIESWSSSIRQKVMRVLSALRASPLTSVLTMGELRAADFLFAMFLRQSVITAETLFDGLVLRDERFLHSDSALALAHYIDQRSFLLEYASSELRLVAVEGAPTLKARILSTLFGSTTMLDGAQIPNVTILDLLDFLAFQLFSPALSPLTTMFDSVDFTVALDFETDATGEAEQPHLVEQLLALRLNELRKSGHLDNSHDQEMALADAEGHLMFYKTQKKFQSLENYRLRTLQAWGNLLTLAIGHCDLDQEGRAALILQALQIVIPKLERYAADGSPESVILGKLVQALLFQMDFKFPALDRPKGSDTADDRLFNVFRTCLNAINVPDGNINLREVLYNICFRYLTGIAELENSTSRQRNITQTVAISGKKTIGIICDDAYGGSGTCRASAVLFLDALAAMATIEKSNYMVDSLARTNFIVVLVEAIRDIPKELQDSEAQETPLLLAYYDSKLALLLTLSRTRHGATQIVNAGLFQMVRDSGIFSVDPDLGISIDNADALSKYYKLLLSVVRVIASVVMSRGSQNQQTIDQAKLFLSENRSLIVAIFKRQARIGAAAAENPTVDVEELVELLVLLMTMTGFIDFEDQRDPKRSRRTAFS
ncbi:MAG: hypothetical protein LQ343_002678 [Gyalolechia ehrenbergii]|nr:MAG: hypothetical protein LQ343_002678 [Gyalolechia ehrenbergii]